LHGQDKLKDVSSHYLQPIHIYTEGESYTCSTNKTSGEECELTPSLSKIQSTQETKIPLEWTPLEWHDPSPVSSSYVSQVVRQNC